MEATVYIIFTYVSQQAGSLEKIVELEYHLNIPKY